MFQDRLARQFPWLTPLLKFTGMVIEEVSSNNELMPVPAATQTQALKTLTSTSARSTPTTLSDQSGPGTSTAPPTKEHSTKTNDSSITSEDLEAELNSMMEDLSPTGSNIKIKIYQLPKKKLIQVLLQQADSKADHLIVSLYSFI